MTIVTGFVTLHGSFSRSWDVLVSDENFDRQQGTGRSAYVGVFEHGMPNEPLLEVMLRALARHKANMLVIGKYTECRTKTYFIDQRGNVYSPPNI